MDSTRRDAQAWLKAETRLACRPTVRRRVRPRRHRAAIAQAGCTAWAVAAALAGHAPPPRRARRLRPFALAQAGLGILSERAAFEAGAGARRRLRSDALARLLAAGPALLRGRHSGELAAIAVDRIEALHGLFAHWLSAAMLAGAGPALVGLAVLCVDPFAALILAGCYAVAILAMAVSGLGAAQAARAQFTAMARLQARFLDRVRGIATIVLAGRAEDEAMALGTAAEELRRRTMRVLRRAFLSSAALDLAAAFALVMLAIRYGRQLAAGTLAEPGAALFVILLVPLFFAPLRAFAAAYQERMVALGAGAELAGLPAPPAPPEALPVRTVAAHGVTIAFEQVRLTWDPGRGPALDNVTFRVPAGETVILAGPSGAGKSTIIEVLLGFVRPDAGRVTFNGADIATIVPQALSRLTAWIGQRPVLFAGTIRDNIRFARPEATDAEVEEAARFAAVAAFAARLPAGLDTPIGEGGFGLSGGEAQRVAVARAFLKNAPVLLLDEPTAHLDPATEAEMLESLRRLAVGRTVGGRDAGKPAPPRRRPHRRARQPRHRRQRLPRPPDRSPCRAHPGRPRRMMPLLRILSLWRGRAWRLGLGLALAILGTAAAVAMMGLAGAMVAAGGAMLAAPLALRILAYNRIVLRYLERLATHDAMFRALADLRVWFFRGLAARSAGGLGFRRAGDLLARLVNDVEALDGLYLRILVPAAGAVLLLPGLALLTGHASVPLAVMVALLFAAAAFLLPAMAARMTRDAGTRLSEAEAGLRIAALDTLSGLREVRAFGAEGRMLALVQAKEAALFAAQDGLARRAAAAQAAALVCGQAALLALLVALGAHPGLVAALFLAVAAFEAIGGLPRAGVLAGHAAAAAGRVIAAAEGPSPVPDPAAPATPPAGSALRFENIHHRWQPDRPLVFDGLSLEIRAGQRVALLGPSGIGKSTLAALALKVAAPDEGRVLLGGADIATLAAADVRARIALLSQSTHLFDDTIRNNLLLARPDADEAALWAALTDARIFDLVRALPDGLDTWVGEGGARFSGGQPAASPWPARCSPRPRS